MCERNCVSERERDRAYGRETGRETDRERRIASGREITKEERRREEKRGKTKKEGRGIGRRRRRRKEGNQRRCLSVGLFILSSADEEVARNKKIHGNVQNM